MKFFVDMAFKFITAEEAAEFIHHNDNVGFSGFTAAGTPKVVSVALAKKAEAEHAAGRPFQIGVYTGASTSDYTCLTLRKPFVTDFSVK